MKKIHFILLALAGALITSCANGDDGLFNDDWEVPETDQEYGNPYIKESNVVTIASLVKDYATVIDNGSEGSKPGHQFNKPIQIKGAVTANGAGGNIYQRLAIDDGTGAIIIRIEDGTLTGQVADGQEILIELNGLWLSGNNKQPEIGTPYTNRSGNVFIGSMARALWQDHFTYTGYRMRVEPVEFDQTKIKDATYLANNCGKLMTIKNVEFKEAGSNIYADEASKDNQNCVNRELKGISKSNLVVRTSVYADYAAKTLPEGKLNITGIFTRYGNTWQILIREESDVKPVQ